MRATVAVNTLLPLVEKLEPRCVAMCGVCAGRRSKARLGNVVASERLVPQAMRKTLALEMESAALGELAYRQRQHKLDVVVMKGVMDFADHGCDDHFKEFAVRVAAECLLWFLRQALRPRRRQRPPKQVFQIMRTSHQDRRRVSP
jgi:nucleoside phosphorylase